MDVLIVDVLEQLTFNTTKTNIFPVAMKNIWWNLMKILTEASHLNDLSHGLGDHLIAIFRTNAIRRPQST